MHALASNLSQASQTPDSHVEGKHPYDIVVLRDLPSLREHLAAWDDLASHACEPNVFYESWALLPALDCLPFDKKFFFVLIYQPINAQRRKPVLCGFFPLEQQQLSPLLPIRVLALLEHVYCFLCTPLLRRGHGSEVLDAFFEWLVNSQDGASLFSIGKVSADGGFARALTDVCWRRRRLVYSIESYARAMLQLPQGMTVEDYLATEMPRKRIREIRRKERILGGDGRLERRVLENEGTIEIWIDQFLALEASGWKGQNGTAMACRPADSRFFREMARGAFARGQLFMLGLFLDDKPVALKCNFLAGKGSFAFKIAFDETYASTSPGILLEIANMEVLQQRWPERWMDSCAIPGHFMISRIWFERRLIQSQLVSTGRSPGDLLVAVLPFARWLKRLVRGCPHRRSFFLDED